MVSVEERHVVVDRRDLVPLIGGPLLFARLLRRVERVFLDHLSSVHVELFHALRMSLCTAVSWTRSVSCHVCAAQCVCRCGQCAVAVCGLRSALRCALVLVAAEFVGLVLSGVKTNTAKTRQVVSVQ